MTKNSPRKPEPAVLNGEGCNLFMSNVKTSLFLLRTKTTPTYTKPVTKRQVQCGPRTWTLVVLMAVKGKDSKLHTTLTPGEVPEAKLTHRHGSIHSTELDVIAAFICVFENRTDSLVEEL